MNIKQLQVLLESGFTIRAEKKFSFWFNLFYKDMSDTIIQLNDLSIGALLEITDKSNLIDIFLIIVHDLKLDTWKMTDNDECTLILYWMDRLDIMMKAFSATDNITIPSDFSSQWSQTDQTIPIPPTIALLDQIARRMGLTYEQASNLRWSEVMWMARIDKKEAYFNYLCSKKQQRK